MNMLRKYTGPEAVYLLLGIGHRRIICARRAAATAPILWAEFDFNCITPTDPAFTAFIAGYTQLEVA
jgi:hypothetical protein